MELKKMGRPKRIRKIRMKLRKQKQERKEILKAHRLPKTFKRMGEMFEEANRGLIKGFKNLGEVLIKLKELDEKENTPPQEELLDIE